MLILVIDLRSYWFPIWFLGPISVHDIHCITERQEVHFNVTLKHSHTISLSEIKEERKEKKEKGTHE